MIRPAQIPHAGSSTHCVVEYDCIARPDATCHAALLSESTWTVLHGYAMIKSTII